MFSKISFMCMCMQVELSKCASKTWILVYCNFYFEFTNIILQFTQNTSHVQREYAHVYQYSGKPLDLRWHVNWMGFLFLFKILFLSCHMPVLFRLNQMLGDLHIFLSKYMHCTLFLCNTSYEINMMYINLFV